MNSWKSLACNHVQFLFDFGRPFLLSLLYSLLKKPEAPRLSRFLISGSVYPSGDG